MWLITERNGGQHQPTFVADRTVARNHQTGGKSRAPASDVAQTWPQIVKRQIALNGPRGVLCRETGKRMRDDIAFNSEIRDAIHKNTRAVLKRIRLVKV